jgi:four helix bundle protein
MGKKYEYELKSEAYKFAVQTKKLLKTIYNDRFCRDMIDQASRSVGSISGNITEAQCSESTKEFIRYHEIALKSGNETIHWLRMIGDVEEKYKILFDDLIQEGKKLTKVLAACIIALRKKL